MTEGFGRTQLNVSALRVKTIRNALNRIKEELK